MKLPPRARVVNADGTMTAEFYRSQDALHRATEASPYTYYYAGNPNSNVTGNVGDLCINTNGGAGTTLYVKESGAGTNTGWVAK